MHVGIAYPWWRGKRSRHSRRKRTRNLSYLIIGPFAQPFESLVTCFFFLLTSHTLATLRILDLWMLRPNILSWHFNYSDVIMARWRLNSPASRLFTQPFIPGQIKESIKAPRHWPLCGNSPVTGELTAQMGSNAENISIWWRHHGNGVSWGILFTWLYPSADLEQTPKTRETLRWHFRTNASPYFANQANTVCCGINNVDVYHGSMGQQSKIHYWDVIMSAMASQITSLAIVYSTL